ncbi:MULTISPECIES: RHS repeat-associated core domain-containing protein [unclassified Pseudomonas]|uniref:RHS repeat-associated core domain-containing protein n=1 Tax=unclassified Pseudomonas TaxID=196821 RepID=UPI000C888F32|nr:MULTISPECIES: RHS repeat-associated core domain-containing protein [unclassified Pseudomonas]PMZ89531.1 Rhs family protein [Pseudomonas sp. FW215-T2]PNA11395.1 Rhs family protein [Pseudomonas sp. FW215-R3]PNB37485.1 Rhs family protein [Pseudomonas sp. FW305-131]
MSNTSRDTVLCRYHYDPLDRQNGCTVLQQLAIQRFHCKSRLTTEIQGAVRWSILQHDDQLLAQQSRLDAKVGTTLLATDQQRSILNALDATQPNPLAYTPYGHRPAENGLLSLLGFNGERPDPVTGHYHLGNGYRQFNPVLMRFNSPDSRSPFGMGGVNAYAYCGGEPVNRNDPTGHTWRPLKIFLRKIGVMKKAAKPKTVVQIGAWQQVPGDPERVQLPSKIPRKQKQAKLTKKEEEQFRKELDKALSDGRNMDQQLRLNNAASTSGNSATSPNRAPNRGALTSSHSAVSDSVEHMPTEELAQFRNTVSEWQNVGTERSNILQTIDSEIAIRELNVFKEPPTSNRGIRRGEPGY